MSSHPHVMVVGKIHKRCNKGNEVLKYTLKCNVPGCGETKRIVATCICKLRPEGKKAW